MKSLAYDVDFTLNGGKPGADEDAAAWGRYRDAILQRGTRLRPDPIAYQYAPLPALAPGRHRICFALVRSNGTRSNEAECPGTGSGCPSPRN